MTKNQTLQEPAPVIERRHTTVQRISSIDILRALTMVLMIFVNDLWSLKNIPQWLEHVERGVDGIGLADVVFPAFLFIVGLSLPFAIDHRRKKGDTTSQLVWHALSRTIALLVMGVYLVNGESIDATAMGMPKFLWYPLCCLSFILIWNVYPKRMNRSLVWIARSIGIITLVTLAILYKGKEGSFAPHWWGILGLIGWAYLVSSLITIFAKNNFYVILAGWVFFAVLSMVSKAGFVPNNAVISAVPDAIRGGTLAGLTMGGVLTSLIFQYYRSRNDNQRMTMVLLGFSAVLIALSIITRPYWKLAKLGATPAWLFLCSAFTILAFTAIYWLADVGKKANWFNIIKPAGTDTLLCYLIPYFMYAIVNATGAYLPGFMLTGGVGLLKSLLFALLCVLITRLLNKRGVKLKL